MNRSFRLLAIVTMSGSFLSAAFGQDKSSEELLSDALSAAQGGRRDQAVKLASQAIEIDAKNAQARYVRGLLYEGMNKHAEAVADFTAAVDIDPSRADTYDHRGSEELKLGHAERAIADFDRAIELDPPREAGHWRRGIAYYFAGRYKEGAKQFEGYQTVDDNDVENAVWRFLCMARERDVDAARKSLLKIKNDRRVPMMEVYGLFAGQTKPDAVLAAARAGKPSDAELKQRLFYAEYYLGLYDEATGDEQAARRHIETAVQNKLAGHYMWDVARVHLDLLDKADRADQADQDNRQDEP